MKPEKLLQLLKQEWERVVLAVICLTGLLAGSFGGLRFVEFFQRDQTPVANSAKFNDAYNKNAFAFVQRDDTVGIAQNHPLTVRPPDEWISRRKRQSMLDARNAAREAAERRRTQERVWEEKKKELAKKLAQDGKPGKDGKDGKTGKDAKPNPPIQHYIVFNGFFQHPEAGQLAYLGRQSVQEDVKRQEKPVFVKTGDEFGDYKIDEIDEDVVILKDKEGRRFEVVRGEPYHYKTEKNPAEMLEPNKERERGEAPRGEPRKMKSTTQKTTKKKGGRTKGKGSAKQLQDLIKAGKLNINNKDIQKALKGGNISTKQIQEMLKKFQGQRKR